MHKIQKTLKMLKIWKYKKIEKCLKNLYKNTIVLGAHAWKQYKEELFNPLPFIVFYLLQNTHWVNLNWFYLIYQTVSNCLNVWKILALKYLFKICPLEIEYCKKYRLAWFQAKCFFVDGPLLRPLWLQIHSLKGML